MLIKVCVIAYNIYIAIIAIYRNFTLFERKTVLGVPPLGFYCIERVSCSTVNKDDYNTP